MYVDNAISRTYAGVSFATGTSLTTIAQATASYTGWQMPDQYVMLRDTVRRFMIDEVKPVEDKLPHDATSPPPDVLARLQASARELGLWCVQSPAE